MKTTWARRMVQRLQLDLFFQERWIEGHGCDRAGYIARYGASNDPNRYGDGGAAIYEADVGELRRIEAALAKAIWQAATGASRE